MVLREKTVRKILPFLLLLGLPGAALAQKPARQSTAILSGNAILPPKTIEKWIRKAVANELKGSFLGSSLRFTTEAVEQDVPLKKPTGELKEILDLLGMKSPIQIVIAPIDVGLILPDSGLKIEIKNLKPNQFSVKARWSVTDVSAKSPNLKIKVPRGVFDRQFEIISTPVEIGMAKKSAPIQVELALTADLLDTGTKIHLVNLKTNLNSEKSPTLYLKLGKLTVDGKPIELELRGNGHSLLATEEAIRSQFQALEPNVTQTIRDTLTKVLQGKFNALSTKIEAEPALKIGLELNEFLKKHPDEEVLQSLLKGVSAEFLFSYLQYVGKQNLFTGQVTSHICFDKECLFNVGTASPISTGDLQAMKPNDDVGVLIYESWLQTVFHSSEIQARIKNYYMAQRKNAGTSFGKDGIRIHFKPEQNAVAIVLNLEINIQKTSTGETSLGKKLKLWGAHLAERILGSGKVVVIPVEVTAYFKGLIRQSDGSYALQIETVLPFKNDDTIVNTFHYPSNVDDMLDAVKGPFLEDVSAEVRKTFPETILVPVGTGVELKDMRFLPSNITITPNHGLMVTGEMRD